MKIQVIALETTRRLIAGVLGLVVLWQVVERAGRGDGEVVVHVAESGLVVLIDGYAYPHDPTPGSPIICSLRPGSHTLSATREGRAVCEETFDLEPGGGAVLTARDAARPTSPQRRRLPTERW